MNVQNADIHINVLGPAELWVRGRRLDLGPAKQRALFVRLLLARGWHVPLEQLLDDLWGCQGARAAHTSVYVYINRLRTLLEPHRKRYGNSQILVLENAGYSLRLPQGAVDAARFKKALPEARLLLERGETAAASEKIDRALGQWRGRAYADAADYPFAAQEIAHLEAMQLEAYELKITAMLEQRQYAEAAASAQWLTSREPLRETAWELLMRSLCLAGRQAEALQQYNHARETFVHALGLEPGAALKGLREMILRHQLVA
ncbi:BTAD domain-containing putative transcriptional regulator [Streptomyces decoyicus]|uniref:AfsR/SARP family transcriptional regulator n=1 Tax=Streptomyces decoyicus TaxID=249567 RepID=UPI0033CA5959